MVYDARWSEFDQIVDILLPGTGGSLAVLQAYFDESEQAGIFSVAGFVFAKPQVKKFAREWSALFDPYGFAHMTDLHARHEQFDGIDDAEAARLCTQAVKIINKRATYGIAVGVDKNELDPLLPKHIEGFEDAYPYCCHMAMMELGVLIGNSGSDDQVAYVFESGNQYSKEAHRLMSKTDVSPELKSAYRHHSHAFVPKECAVPLQAADLLAWEYARYWDLTVRQSKIPMRKSFAALLSRGFTTMEFNDRFKINFYTGRPLREAMQKINTWDAAIDALFAPRSSSSS